MIFTEHINGLKQFIKNQEELVIECVRTFENEVLEMNKEQLHFGELSTGKNIVPPYKPLTVVFKLQRGQPFDRVTLEDKGNFQKRFFVVWFNDSFSIESTDPKAFSLELKYSKDIFGLNEENLERLAELIKPCLQEKFKTLIC